MTKFDTAGWTGSYGCPQNIKSIFFPPASKYPDNNYNNYPPQYDQYGDDGYGNYQQQQQYDNNNNNYYDDQYKYEYTDDEGEDGNEYASYEEE